MKSFILKKKFYIPAIAIVVILLLFSFRGKKESYEYVQVVLSDVRQEVSVTGTVKPLQSVALSFERAGRIAAVPVEAGQKVSQWQSLLWLDATNAQLELKQAESSLVADRAKLLELERGTRPEDVAILEAKVASARVDVSQAQQKLFDALEDVYTSADDAVRNYADQFFDNPRSSAPQLNILVSNAQLRSDLSSLRIGIESMFASWSSSISNSLSSANVATLSRTNLNLVKEFLDKLSLAVNALTPSQSLSATTISTYRGYVSTARSSISTAITSLTTAENNLTTAQSDLVIAEKNLLLAEAGTVPEQVDAQRALIALDEAKRDAAVHQVSTSVIRAPFAGVVTKQDGKIGQVVSANQELVWIISGGKLEVEAFVPEVDIGSISVGDVAEVTFDAFSGETFKGEVSYIDPAETVIDGVPTYKIRLKLDTADERVRSGMTANLSILVAEHAQTPSIPYRAVISKDGGKFVSVKNSSGEVSEIPIEIGIRGVSGEVEVISGLSEGDTIAIPTRK